MVYIHNTGSLNLKEGEEFDVKNALKEATGKPFRRTDRFIQMALLGAHSAVGEEKLDASTALYMASGQGNLAVFTRLRDQQYVLKQPPKPVDFINSLSNTAGFYVAQHLGLHGKNLNLNQHGFVVYMTLLLAQNDLCIGAQEQVLVGGVDELLEPLSFTKKFLGICDGRKLGEGSNWLLFNSRREGALAYLDVVREEMTLSGLKAYLCAAGEKTKVAFGLRFSEAIVKAILDACSMERFRYEEGCGFYETAALYTLIRFIEEGEGEMLFVENFEEKFRVIRVGRLRD